MPQHYMIKSIQKSPVNKFQQYPVNTQLQAPFTSTSKLQTNGNRKHHLTNNQEFHMNINLALNNLVNIKSACNDYENVKQLWVRNGKQQLSSKREPAKIHLFSHNQATAPDCRSESFVNPISGIMKNLKYYLHLYI